MTRTPLKRAIGYVWPATKSAVVNFARRVGLSRKAPIGFGAALKACPLRRGNLQRNTPIRKRTEKQAARQRNWNAITEAKIRAGVPCAWPGCKTHPTHGHHWKPTGRGGAWTIDNHLLVCANHHREIHDRPLLAATLGLIQSSKAGAS